MNTDDLTTRVRPAAKAAQLRRAAHMMRTDDPGPWAAYATACDGAADLITLLAAQLDGCRQARDAARVFLADGDAQAALRALEPLPHEIVVRRRGR